MRLADSDRSGETESSPGVISSGRNGQPRGLTELASGVDALYLSGRTALPRELLERLEAGRVEAEALDGGLPCQFGSLPMLIAPHAFGKHRYSLDHPYVRIGLSPKLSIPALRVQPRAEFLHGVGARATVDTLQDLLESECGAVKLQVSRIDLFVDVQGWPLRGDDRTSFICRAAELNTSEVHQGLTGLQFGRRSTGTINARIYDKTEELKHSGAEYWKEIWGDGFDRDLPVHRIEYEVARGALREFGLNDPHEVLDATGALWAYLTRWLSHRVPSGDSKRSRWSVSRYWEDISRANLTDGSWGLERTYGGSQRGEMGKILPALMGYLARFGALSDSYSEEEMLENLRSFVTRYAKYTHTPMEYRIRQKRRELGLL
ncbi:MAG TPA: hypothetical protein VND89_00860 [Acidimicrobiales bacterium]|nr:hypothetical protein [Acidimicrobiales bacterium]